MRCPAPPSADPSPPAPARRWLPALALITTLALAACTSPGASSPQTSGDRQAGRSAQVIPGLAERALLMLLADRKIFESIAVGRGLAGPPALRAELATTLGRVGDPKGRTDLEMLLADRETAVRQAAAFALGELGDAAAAPALLAAAAGDDGETARLAVEALGKLGTPLPDVVAALDPLPEEERWRRLLPHLFRFDAAARAPFADRGLAVTDPALHARAAYALARNPIPASAPRLRELLVDPDPWVRGLAARALGEVGAGEDLDRLLPLLADPAPGPVIQALAAAARLVAAGTAAAPAAWREPLAGLLADPRPQVRMAAVASSSAWLLDDTLGASLAEMASGGELWLRSEALLALARGGDPRAADLASGAATDTDPALRARAAEAAGLLPADSATALLDRLLLDPDPRVRAAALDASTVAAGDGAAALVGEVIGADTDAGVRAAAFGWLAEHPLLPAEVLAQPTLWALADRNVESSLNAVKALAARAEAAPLDRGALIEVLERLAEKGDFTVRREASAALAQLDRPAPPVGSVETRLDVDHYEAIVLRTLQPRNVELRTSAGTLTLRLECPEAPLTCLNFLNLAAQGFYDGLTFHRVVPDFVVQGGDPRGDGWGGPGYTIRDEINRLRYERGAVGMALAGPDTGGSQFFITLSSQPHLDGGYTLFGRVVAGDEVLDRIVRGTRIEGVVELD